MSIGLYDSGIGGLSIYKEVKKILPNEDYIYIADKKFFPYGKLSKKQICDRTDKIVGWLKSKNVKLVIIACNTATVNAIKYIRDKHPDLPIIGTVPVIKTCVEKTKNRNIGVLCTTKTANSAYQKKLIREFAINKNVYIKACPGLVELIEKGDINKENYKAVLLDPINYLENQNIDTLALGCTHFPLVKNEIQAFFTKKPLILDSGKAIARQVKRVLKNNKLLKITPEKGSLQVFTTSNHKKFGIIVSRYVDQKIKVIPVTI